METTKLKKFAQHARRLLLEQVGAKLSLVLYASSAARRENPQAVARLEKQIAANGREQLIDKVAYTWFNRFCALRFMDVNGYTRIRVVSPADEGQFQPEILAEAKAGHIDDERVPEKVRQQIQALLSGNTPSHDPQQEAYRLLVVAECNAFHSAMPYLFERIADYTELLMPDDLLSGNSILAYTREAMTLDACQDVEVIGWLYQFYISEKKDAVFDGLKKNQKINPENIPAATQLFTPHWIVRYLVENSLGRLWLLNNPNSALAGQMDYYIKPEAAEADFLKIARPENIKVCDPACGSGHMLTYAFDLLYAIYEEVGTDPSEIPEKILTHNLYGIELDERAGELAAFALTMKARAKQRRFFNKAIKPNICVLEKVEFSHDELDEYISSVGSDLFTLDLRETLKQFEEADNFGSLIRPKLTGVQNVLPVLEAKDMVGNLFLASTHAKVLQVLRMTEYLSPHYAVVVANPPYMGGKGMNGRLGAWAKENYPNSKSDLFAMFIERGFDLTPKHGYSAMVTMQSWMFLSSYESLRERILRETSIECMAHMANMVMGIAFGTAATVCKKGGSPKARGAYCYVDYEDIGEDNKPMEFPPRNERNRKAVNQREAVQ
ncbi:BREX-1 system adenine-specific DNA-methyltransferase PglX [Pseudomonas iridis]|uniref:BREX-1 system adenine-specific DNA-methyltransferase PglX n=1 Tax=Pseudomonas iridis TaxID=2710587 RepID=UPI0037C51AEF